MRKFSTNKLCLLALCSVINLIGGHIALLFRLPVYLDSLGTVFAAALMGPLSGMIPGIISNLIGGVTTDIYALYYLPVQMITGGIAGLLFQKISFHERKRLIKILLGAGIVSIPGTVIDRVWRNYFFRIHTSGATAPSSWSGINCQRLYRTRIDRLCRQSHCSCFNGCPAGYSSFFHQNSCR